MPSGGAGRSAPCPSRARLAGLAGVGVGIGVAFGGVEVLHDVDLALAAGRWSAVVGPNGVGKSTLLRVLDRLQRGHCGEVRLGGAPLTALAGWKRARSLSWLRQDVARMMTKSRMGEQSHDRNEIASTGAGLRPVCDPLRSQIKR